MNWSIDDWSITDWSLEAGEPPPVVVPVVGGGRPPIFTYQRPTRRTDDQEAIALVLALAV